jgi:hypothetical protein
VSLGKTIAHRRAINMGEEFRDGNW